MATSLAAVSMTDFSEQISVSVTKQDAASNASCDRRRTWLWSFLAIIAAAQLNFVREVFALYVFFAIGFVALASVVVAIYMLRKVAELGLARASAVRSPILGMAAVKSMAVAATVAREHRKAA